MDQGMEFIRILSTIPANNEHTSARAFFDKVSAEISTEGRTKAPFEDLASAALRICNREYWQRLWIIQEIFLPPTVYVWCGAKEIQYEQLFKAIQVSSEVLESRHVAKEHRKLSLRSSLATPVVLGRRMCHDKPANLLHLLQQFRRSDCKDIRDKLFGIIHLTVYARHAQTLVNYSFDELQIFANTMRVVNLRDASDAFEFTTWFLIHLGLARHWPNVVRRLVDPEDKDTTQGYINGLGQIQFPCLYLGAIRSFVEGPLFLPRTLDEFRNRTFKEGEIPYNTTLTTNPTQFDVDDLTWKEGSVSQGWPSAIIGRWNTMNFRREDRDRLSQETCVEAQNFEA